MKNSLTITAIVIATIALLVTVFYPSTNSIEVPTTVGSIAQSPYKATTTDATWSQASKFKVLKTGSGYLGSVVISGATAAAGLNFYDATTTGPHANHATTSIAVLNVSSPAGTYTFDVAFQRGLVVEFPSAIGAASSTITWQ